MKFKTILADPRQGKGIRDYCKTCGVKLTSENTWPSDVDFSRYRCKQCSNKYQRKYQRAYQKNKRIELRKKVMKRLGNKCIRCGYKDIRALQIDHIDGGGTAELRSMTGLRYYTMLLELPEDVFFSRYQCLCANCNWIKAHETGELFHRSKKGDK